MKEKLYICRTCGFVFPQELARLIENKTQVYCEKCGTPFTLPGIQFRPYKAKQEKKVQIKDTLKLTSTQHKKLVRAIKIFDKFSYLPFLIFSCFALVGISQIFISYENILPIISNHIMIPIIGLLIVIHDVQYTSRKIKKEEFDDIFLDPLIYGILGLFIFGLSVFILIKGILVVILVSLKGEDVSSKSYDLGVKGKKSLNYISTKAGFLILVIGISTLFEKNLNLWVISLVFNLIKEPLHFINIIWLKFMAVGIVSLFLIIIGAIIFAIDKKFREKIDKNDVLELRDNIKILIIGIIGTVFFNIGIIILIKAILMLVLRSSKPPQKLTPIPPVSIAELKRDHVMKKEDFVKESLEKEEIVELSEEKLDKAIIKDEEPQKMVDDYDKTIFDQIEEEAEPESVSKEINLKLHDSFLPGRNENEKKVVKKYFSKIFNVLSKSIRKKILDLKIPRKDKKLLIEELAFLTEKEQVKYIEAIEELYREIPKKLINRVKKLPKMREHHFNEILEQLKQMDSQEQVEYIQFLENNSK